MNDAARALHPDRVRRFLFDVSGTGPLDLQVRDLIDLTPDQLIVKLVRAGMFQSVMDEYYQVNLSGRTTAARYGL